MSISITELINKVTELSISSEQLSTKVACAAQDLKRQTYTISALAHGSRSGEDAVAQLKESVKSLEHVSSLIVLVMSACDDYVRNAVK